jgi:hypothetical protein
MFILENNSPVGNTAAFLCKSNAVGCFLAILSDSKIILDPWEEKDWTIQNYWGRGIKDLHVLRLRK